MHGETEMRGHEVTCPKSPNRPVIASEIEPRSPDPPGSCPNYRATLPQHKIQHQVNICIIPTCTPFTPPLNFDTSM